MTKLEEYIEACARLRANNPELMLDFGQPAESADEDVEVGEWDELES